MSAFEYKVIPAPTRGLKAKGIRTAEARFAHALETAINDLAAEGWEYQRADTLPLTQRSGLTGTSTEWRHLLVFRRAVVTQTDTADAATQAPDLLPPPTPHTDADIIPATVQDTGNDMIPGPGVTHMLPDNGVEDTSEVSGMTDSLSRLAKQRGTDHPDKS